MRDLRQAGGDLGVRPAGKVLIWRDEACCCAVSPPLTYPHEGS